MILNDFALHTLCEHTQLVHPYQPENVGPCSVDLTLSPNLKFEGDATQDKIWFDWDLIKDGPFVLRPGEFVLASTAEVISMPRDRTGELVLRSSAARMGLDHCFSGLVDPGFYGQLTLELRNNLRHHSIELCDGMRLVQMVVTTMTSQAVQSYDTVGFYQGQAGPTVSNLRVKREHRARANNRR